MALKVSQECVEVGDGSVHIMGLMAYPFCRMPGVETGVGAARNRDSKIVE